MCVYFRSPLLTHTKLVSPALLYAHVYGDAHGYLYQHRPASTTVPCGSGPRVCKEKPQIFPIRNQRQTKHLRQTRMKHCTTCIQIISTIPRTVVRTAPWAQTKQGLSPHEGVQQLPCPAVSTEHNEPCGGYQACAGDRDRILCTRKRRMHIWVSYRERGVSDSFVITVRRAGRLHCTMWACM